MFKTKSSKTATPCPNPVFEVWIQDWHDDAAAKELQSRFTFKKCLNSLRKYPLPLKTGKECIILEGFGDKICKSIDEKLKVFLDEGGILHESDKDENCVMIEDDEFAMSSNYVSIPVTKSKTKSTKRIKKVYLNEDDDYDDDLVSLPCISNQFKPIQPETTNIENSQVSTSSKLLCLGKSKSKSTKSKKEVADINDGNSNHDMSENISSTNKKTSKRGKEYVPEFRSGAYAILVTLYNHETSTQGENCKYMLKNQLIKEAQKNSDASFTSSDPNNHYTAWNSMSNLIKKNLVFKENKLPARYILTDTGRRLAYKILYGFGNNDEDKDDINEMESESVVENETEHKSRQKKVKKSTEFSNTCEIVYSDNEHQSHNHYAAIAYHDFYDNKATNDYISYQNVENKAIKNEELYEIEEDKGIFAKTVTEEAKKQTLDEQLIELIDSDSDSDIITLEEDRPKTLIPASFEIKAQKSTTAIATKDFVNFIDDDDDDDFLPDLGLCSATNKLSKKQFTLMQTKNSQDFGSTDTLQVLDTNSRDQYSSSSNRNLDSLATTGLTQNFKSTSIISSKGTNLLETKSYSFNTASSKEATATMIPSTKSFSSSASSSSSSQTPNVVSKFLPGSYEVILFVDNCEQSHVKGQDVLMDELKKSKIPHDFGKLNVGDFAWVARDRNGLELILDCIIERKRMDDLCQSIMDGRYKEQKFRLKKCGITRLIYLIEDYGSMKHMSLPEKSIVQADINTQLIDEFIVHHTTDPKDSANYLIQMTHYMIEKHKNVTLNGCVKAEVDELNKKRVAGSCKNNSLAAYLMTLKEFNQFSNKNKPLTIKEMFAKCLMKIQGLSQEKCIAIIELYPTPALLIQAYSKCSDEASRSKLLANLKYGSQQRNIGPVISKLIAHLFYTNSPLN